VSDTAISEAKAAKEADRDPSNQFKLITQMGSALIETLEHVN
jgi:hypothetical protein